MAVINLSPLTLIQDCPNVNIKDDNQYYNTALSYGDFKFHDFVTEISSNESNTINGFKFGTFEFTGVTIDIETDGSGNIINPEAQYNALVELLDSFSEDFKAILIKPSEKYRQWYIRIYSTTTSYAGQSIDATIPVPKTLNPFLGVIEAAKSISDRNITLILPDGTEADLGATKQVDEIVFSSSEYTVGQIFTLTFCNDTITYTVTDDNDAECVAKGINELIQAENSESYFTKYLTSSVSDNKIILTANNAGVPFSVTVGYDGTESYSISNVTGNVSNLTSTGFLQGDSVDYKYIERGGEYEFILTVLSECDYNQSSIKKLSWCYDKQQFDCCFINAIEKLKCKCKKGSNVCYIYNVKRSIEYMLDNNYSQEDIQKVVDLGWSLCTSDCGCK